MSTVICFEKPLGFGIESYLIDTTNVSDYALANITISISTTITSKFYGYIPLFGSMIGLRRIFQGILEYKIYNEKHIHFMSNRSIQWMYRGALELIPILGGLICLIIDLANRSLPNDYSTPHSMPKIECKHCQI